MKKISKRLIASFLGMLILILSTGCTMSPKYEIQNEEYYNDAYEFVYEALTDEYDQHNLLSAINHFIDFLDIFREDYRDGIYDDDTESLSYDQDRMYAEMNAIADVLDEVLKELSNNEEKERTLKEVETIIGEDFTEILDEVITKQIELLKLCNKEISIIKNKYDGNPLEEKYYTKMQNEIESYATYQEEIMEHASNMAIGKLFGGILNGGFDKMMEEAFSVFY